jgi:hypothetical protein
VIEDILSRLDKVKRTGANNWMACCPAHDDRSPSLTITSSDEGKVAVKCFAECSFESIVEAVGLGYEAWFPPKPIELDRSPAIRRPFPAGDVLESLAFESTVVAVAACNLANGIELTAEDKERLLVAYERIQRGRDLAIGR